MIEIASATDIFVQIPSERYTIKNIEYLLWINVVTIVDQITEKYCCQLSLAIKGHAHKSSVKGIETFDLYTLQHRWILMNLTPLTGSGLVTYLDLQGWPIDIKWKRIECQQLRSLNTLFNVEFE